MFKPSKEKPFVATAAAIEAHRQETIIQCLEVLREQAERYNGLDYLQVFQNTEPSEPDLWAIEDKAAITFLLPSDY
ncbi:hypothetical protein [Blastopirellula marina]|uniref:Uncharacterized protein n=1 Tax=Blastopirellula marina TaxID=124 RepID=A0A2S8GSK3_9BACT|nr:hypothetical protein [Blastopirellula marina]PQO47408.1 hypothetical protein C5Y93_05020 [Blastopirellula marina]